MNKTLPGLNVTEPWASLLINGTKSVETRSYALPKKYEGVELALIATHGKNRKIKSQIIGTVVFSHCFEYKNLSEWTSDSNRHCVYPDSKYYWDATKEKFGWVVSKVEKFNKTLDAPAKRGIIFARECVIDSSFWSIIEENK